MYSSGKICVQKANLAWRLTQGLSLPATIQTISGKNYWKKKNTEVRKGPNDSFG